MRTKPVIVLLWFLGYLRSKWTLIPLGIGVFGFLAWYSPGVHVVIRNSTAVPLVDVQLKFNGGSKHVPLIRPEHAISANVNPLGESGLQLEFTQGTAHRSQTLDIYMEHDYAGSVFLTVDGVGNVNVQSKIKLRWYSSYTWVIPWVLGIAVGSFVLYQRFRRTR